MLEGSKVEVGERAKDWSRVIGYLKSFGSSLVLFFFTFWEISSQKFHWESQTNANNLCYITDVTDKFEWVCFRHFFSSQVWNQFFVIFKAKILNWVNFDVSPSNIPKTSLISFIINFGFHGDKILFHTHDQKLMSPQSLVNKWILFTEAMQDVASLLESEKESSYNWYHL